MTGRTLTLLAGIASAAVAPLRGQAQPDTSKSVSIPLVSAHQLKVAGLAVAATLALAPFDKRLNADTQRPRLQSDDELHSAANDLSFLGGPGPFIIGATFVAVGKVANVGGSVASGSRITESVLLAAAITAFGKGLAGRALPGVQTKHAFSFGRGFHEANGDFVSFPSGHTAAAFALAGALTAEAERSPHSWTPAVRPIAFIMATGVAVARVYQDTHWPSDLPIAAVIGMWSASTVERRVKRKADDQSRISFGEIAVVPQGHRLVALSSLSF